MNKEIQPARKLTITASSKFTRANISDRFKTLGWITWVTLAASLLLTALAWWLAESNNDRFAKVMFESRAQKIEAAIRERLQAYELVLRGGVGLFLASERVNRQGWRTYVENLKIELHYPGIQGIGFSQRVLPRDKAQHTRRIRAEGFPRYTLWPEGQRDEYTAIIYLEPFDWRNRRAFGFDMFSEPVRHAAMARARDTGEAQISGKIVLVQETEEDTQAGFLMYLPLYRNGADLASVAQRRAALQGYVYSPFRMDDFMRGILGPEFQNIRMRVYDGSGAREESLMHDSSPVKPGMGPLPKPLFAFTSSFETHGHPWTLRFESLPAFRKTIDSSVSHIVLAAGIIISLLFTGIVWSLANTRARALALANNMTSALRASEEHFRSVAQTAYDAIVSADGAGNIISWNRGAEALFGYPEAEALGKPITMLMPERYTEAHQRGFERFRATGESRLAGKVVELHARRKDGTEFPIALSLSHWKTDAGSFHTSIIRDITAAKQAEDTLRKSEERFRLLVDGVKDYAIYMLDPQGHVSSWNTGAERINGYTSDQIIGQHFSVFFPAEERGRGKPEQELEVARREGKYEGQGWRLRRDGSRFWADVVVAAIYDVSGELRGYAKITRDITERRKAEESIAALNEELSARNSSLELANREIESFSYSVSHDLRTPLRGIDGFSQVLLEEYGHRLDTEGKKLLQRVRAASQRMAQLIDDMLQLSRITRAEMSHGPVDLSAIAHEIVTELARTEPRRQVRIYIADNLKTQGDPRLLRVALSNLIGNAWKFTAKKDNAEIHVGVNLGVNEQPAFFIRDNGAGFDMTYSDKLFKAFQRLHKDTEFSGTGIGLATVQRIIERHGGRIWAESESGKGATFYFELPADDPVRAQIN